MFQFEIGTFVELLKAAPEPVCIFEPEEYSEYLQKTVFDPLKNGENIALKDLDFSAFSLRNVTPDNLIRCWRRELSGWTQSFNRFVKRTPAEAVRKREFF